MTVFRTLRFFFIFVLSSLPQMGFVNYRLSHRNTCVLTHLVQSWLSTSVYRALKEEICRERPTRLQGQLVSTSNVSEEEKKESFEIMHELHSNVCACVTIKIFFASCFRVIKKQLSKCLGE